MQVEVGKQTHEERDGGPTCNASVSGFFGVNLRVVVVDIIALHCITPMIIL